MDHMCSFIQSQIYGKLLNFTIFTTIKLTTSCLKHRASGTRPIVADLPQGSLHLGLSSSKPRSGEVVRNPTLMECRRHKRSRAARWAALRVWGWGISYLWPISEETVRRLRPLARRRERTLRPLGVDILSRKPCLFTLLRLWGW